jgi:hypothetical protein
MSHKEYVAELLALYTRLPGTRPRPSRQDRQLALALHDQQIPLQDLRAALLLAAARRTLRSPKAAPLPPIGCLHYFLPVLDEVRATRPDHDYIQHLEQKLQPHLKPPTQLSTTGQKDSLSRGR